MARSKKGNKFFQWLFAGGFLLFTFYLIFMMEAVQTKDVGVAMNFMSFETFGRFMGIIFRFIHDIINLF